MNFIFIAEHLLVNELLSIVNAFKLKGYDTDTVQFGQSWEEFLGEVPDGATVVVYSVDFFPSLMELLTNLVTLQERGISLKSLQEPWLSEEIDSTADFLLKLKSLALVLHQNRTRAGLAKARAEGKTLGRPKASARRGRG